MYGIVNQAVQGLVIDKFGEDSWGKILVHSQVKEEDFLSNELYDDDITFRLAISTSKILDIDLSIVLVELGKYWILKTGKERYGALLESGGSHFKDFMINLPNFHSRVMLMYPKITPPEFKVTHIVEKSMCLHYYSQRTGLADFVSGLIDGLMILFKVTGSHKMIESREDGFDHETFEINWE